MTDEQPCQPAEPKPAAIELKLPTIYARLSPLGVYLQARTLQRAADFVRTAPQSQPGAVAFLHCRAIELAFKAYLVARGQSVDSMARYGHDLVLLLTETDAWGIDVLVKLTAEDKALIRTAAELYENHKLGYFDLMNTVAGPRLPLGDLARIATQLLDALEGPCLDATDTPTWKPAQL